MKKKTTEEKMMDKIKKAMMDYVDYRYQIDGSLVAVINTTLDVETNKMEEIKLHFLTTKWKKKQNNSRSQRKDLS